MAVAYVYCVVAGLVAGVAGGLFGVGGGIIIVPFFVLALKFGQHKAQGTSLFALTLPIAAVGAYNYYDRDSTNVLVGLILAAGILGGSFLGSKVALGISPKAMRRSFSVFMVFIALWLFFKAAVLGDTATEAAEQLPAWMLLVSLAAGLFAGMAGGLYGVGGGIVVVPFMVLALGFPQHLAQGTSLLALALPVAGLGAYNYYKKGNTDVKSALFVALGFVAGGLFGSLFALSLDPVTMQRSFAAFVVLTGGYLFFRK